VFDVKPGKAGQINQVINAADKYGNQTRVRKGVDVSVSEAARRGDVPRGNQHWENDHAYL